MYRWLQKIHRDLPICDMIKGNESDVGNTDLSNSLHVKDVTNSYILHCFELQRIFHIFATTCPIEMGFGSKCSTFNGQVIYIKNSKLNIVDM